MGLEREAGYLCIAVQVRDPGSVDLEHVLEKEIFS